MFQLTPNPCLFILINFQSFTGSYLSYLLEPNHSPAFWTLQEYNQLCLQKMNAL